MAQQTPLWSKDGLLERHFRSLYEQSVSKRLMDDDHFKVFDLTDAPEIKPANRWTRAKRKLRWAVQDGRTRLGELIAGQKFDEWDD